MIPAEEIYRIQEICNNFEENIDVSINIDVEPSYSPDSDISDGLRGQVQVLLDWI